MKIPIKIEDPSDYRPGTKIARIIEKKVWLVEITMPKTLMSDIRTGSIDLEEQELDLTELDNAYTVDTTPAAASVPPGAAPAAAPQPSSVPNGQPAATPPA